jgi:TRAP-type uncharacterized transport system fused permease subunit
MVGIALATASAGIVVGSISLTGVGQVLVSVVETLAMGHLPLVLIFTAVLAVILGMGLPTTANYTIVSTLLVPVIYNLSAAHGLALPIFGVHLFCLYFGVMADSTPPSPWPPLPRPVIPSARVQGFYYELRTALLPFVFPYHPELLLLNIQNAGQLLWVIRHPSPAYAFAAPHRALCSYAPARGSASCFSWPWCAFFARTFRKTSFIRRIGILPRTRLMK